MRAAIDVHLIVHSLLQPSGMAGPVLRLLGQGAYALVYSNAWLDDLTRGLSQPALRQKYHLAEADVQALVSLILLRGEPVFPLKSVAVCEQAGDNRLIEAAFAGNVTVIVSDKRELLTLHFYQQIPIVSSAAFYNLAIR